VLSHDTCFLPTDSNEIMDHYPLRQALTLFSLGIMFPAYQDKRWDAQDWQATHLHSLDFLFCERRFMVHREWSWRPCPARACIAFPTAALVPSNAFCNMQDPAFTLKRHVYRRIPGPGSQQQDVCHQDFFEQDSSDHLLSHCANRSAASIGSVMSCL